MTGLNEGVWRILILGAGRGGTAMLEMLHDEALAKVVAVVDIDAHATGIMQAKTLGIAVYTDIKEALAACAPCLVFNLSNSETAEKDASKIVGIGSVVGGVEARLIWRMVTNLKIAKEKVEYQASHDHLTGLHNRHFVTEQIQQAFHQVARYNIDYSLVLIDLDHFKHINDCYGHPVGDIALKKVSETLQKSIRLTDVLGRWGGEEFIVLLPHTNAHDAQFAAQLWLQRVQNICIHLADGEEVNISFSAGVAALKVNDQQESPRHIEALLKTVDQYLYQAKTAGRACIVGECE